MIRTLALILGLSLTLGAAAVQSEGAGPLRPRTSSFEPCGWWTYDFQSNNYSCRNPGMRITVYTQSEVASMVRTLESRIQALESRLAIVEQKLP